MLHANSVIYILLRVVSAAPMLDEHWVPQEGSPLIGNATICVNQTDLYGKVRASISDIGAVEK